MGRQGDRHRSARSCGKLPRELFPRSTEQFARSCHSSVLRNAPTTSGMRAMLQYDREPLLVAAHVGERGAATSAIETQDAALAARIEVATHTVGDLDRRLNQVDMAIEPPSAAGPRRRS